MTNFFFSQINSRQKGVKLLGTLVLLFSFLGIQAQTTCFDNNTGNNTTDDVIEATINLTGSNPAGYTVSGSCPTSGISGLSGGIVDAPNSNTVLPFTAYYVDGGGESGLNGGSSLPGGTYTFRVRDNSNPFSVGTIGTGTKYLRLTNYSQTCWITLPDPGVSCSTPPPCGITLNNVDIGSCNLTNNAFPLSFDVNWVSAPTGEDITVTISSGESYTFTPSTADGSTTVTFNLVSDGLPRTATATFSTTTSCTGSLSNLFAPNQCYTPLCQAGPGIIGGVAFQDNNLNGQYNFGESGAENIIVSIYEAGNPVAVQTTTTNTAGEYQFTGLNDALQYRIEFALDNTPYFEPATSDNANTTAVQFSGTNTCNIDFGVVDPGQVCDLSNLRVFVPCYVNGTANNTEVAIVAFNYDGSGNKQAIATVDQVGTVWGEAYSRQTNTLYASTVYRRHSGLTANGTGAIYTIDYSNPSSPTLSLFTTLPNTGADVHSGLPAGGANNDPSYDVASFDAVGKTGIGDIDITEDGTRLFATNLNTRTVVELDAVTGSVIQDYPVPSSACPNPGDIRPWGLKVYRDEVYVGVVCSGETTGSQPTGHIYKLTGGAGSMTYSLAADIDLSYQKPVSFNHPCYGGGTTTFKPWTSVWPVTNVSTGATLPGTSYCINPFGSGEDYVSYEQPIISDIEFDQDGSLIIGILDRFGLQSGFLNYGTDVTSTRQYVGISGGDILRLCNVNGTLVQGGQVGCPYPNSGTEYYTGDYYVAPGGAAGHEETSLGALLYIPGQNDVAVVSYDPIDGGSFNAGGIRWMDNTSGLWTRGYEVYTNTGTNPGTFAKAAGLGDIEAACSVAGNQIGNYIWEDTNNDGVQDPGEAPIEGMFVSLYTSDGVFITTTTTGPNGEYYFDVQPDSTYKVVFGTDNTTSQFNTGTGALTIAGTEYFLTVPNSGVGSTPDENDSDATLQSSSNTTISGLPTIDVTTGAPGQSNHTYDAGFATVPVCIPPIAEVSADQTICIGDAALVFTASPSTGVDYVWFGPLADTTSGVGSPIAGANLSTYTASGTDITTSGTKYYAVVINTTGETCYDTAYVQLVVNALPDAGPDESICQPASSITLSPVTTGGTFSQIGTTPAITTISGNDISGLTTAGQYSFEYTLNGCTDTVLVTVEAKPEAGPDESICQPLSTITLSPITTGGTFSQIGTTPAVAVISGNDISGLTTAGTYQFEYLVGSCTDTLEITVNAKPDAGADQSLACADPVNGILTTATTLVPGSSGGTFTQISGPVSATIAGNDVTGMTDAGTYQFEYVLDGCTDTVNVVVEPCAGCVTPDAGPDTDVCEPTTTATLSAVTTGGTWAPAAGNSTSIDASGNVSNLGGAGTYAFVYSVVQGGQTCTDTAIVTVNAKPDAGLDELICEPQTTASLNAVSTGGTWEAVLSPANPAVAVIDVNGNISGMTANGNYQFVYSLVNGTSTCSDTAMVIRNGKPQLSDTLTYICAGDLTSLFNGDNLSEITNGVWYEDSVGGNIVTSAFDVSPDSTTDYYFVGESALGCTDTSVHTVIVNQYALANDTTLVCTGTSVPVSVDLSSLVSPSGGQWSDPGGNPSGALINNSGVVTINNSLAQGNSYQFRYTPNYGNPISCYSTITMTVPTCTIATYSIGNFVWYDANNNGEQDGSESGIPNVSLILYQGSTPIDTVQTDGTGSYLFTGVPDGNYTIRIDTSSVPDSLQISPKVNASGVPETLNSDFSPITLESDPIVISGADDLDTDLGFKTSPNYDIVDPCTCFDVEYGKAEIKELVDSIVVTSSPGETWTLTANNGALEIDSLNIADEVNLGTVLTEITPGIYTLKFNHYEGIGYNLTVKNEFGDSLSIGAVCNVAYPILTVDAIPDSVCFNDAPLALNATTTPTSAYQFYYYNNANARVDITELNPADFSPGDVIQLYIEVASVDSSCGFRQLVDSVSVTTLNCAPCAIASLTGTPSACNPLSNSYSVSGEVTFTDAPATGSLIITLGSQSQSFTAPFTSPVNYTLTGLISNGALGDLTATFSDDTACTETIQVQAPPRCLLVPCTSPNCGTATVIKN